MSRYFHSSVVCACISALSLKFKMNLYMDTALAALSQVFLIKNMLYSLGSKIEDPSQKLCSRFKKKISCIISGVLSNCVVVFMLYKVLNFRLKINLVEKGNILLWKHV